MSNNQVELAKRVGATYVGKETAFADGLNPLRCFPKEPPMLKVSDETVQPLDELSTPFARRPPRRGRRTSAGKLKLGWAGDPVISVVAPTLSDVIPQDKVLECLLGGRFRAFGSTVVATGTTASAVEVTTGHGAARFRANQCYAFPVAGVWHVRPVASISGDILTLAIPLPGVPTTGGIIHNGTHWYPSWAPPPSMTLQHAQADESVTNFQTAGRGMTGDFKLNLTPKEEVTFETSLEGADGSTFQDLSYSVAAASKVTTDDFYNIGGYTHLKSVTASAIAFEHVPLQMIEPTFAPGNYLKKEYGGTNGITGVGRKPQSPFSTLKIKAMADRDLLTDYLAGTAYSLLFVLPDTGTGATQRFSYFWWPTLRMPETPDYEGVEEEARQGLYTFEATETEYAVGTTDGTRAPFVCGIL